MKFLFQALWIFTFFSNIFSTENQTRMPELHLHIGGAWPLSFLEKVATKEDFKELTRLLNQTQMQQLDYHQVFPIFNLISRIICTEELIEEGVAELCKSLALDRVDYVEMRTGLKDLGQGYESYLNAILRGIERGQKESSLEVGLILSLRRDSSYDLATNTVFLTKKYYQRGVVGLDLSGDSTVGKGEYVIPALLEAKQEGIPLTLHIGESIEESPEQQLFELTTLQPKRIGHAVHLSSKGFEYAFQNKVLIEMCLTSAVMTGMIKEAKDHPALKLLLNGYPVAICTDDPLLFNTTLSKEYKLVKKLIQWSFEEIQENQNLTKEYWFKSKS